MNENPIPYTLMANQLGINIPTKYYCLNDPTKLLVGQNLVRLREAQALRFLYAFSVPTYLMFLEDRCQVGEQNMQKHLHSLPGPAQISVKRAKQFVTTTQEIVQACIDGGEPSIEKPISLLGMAALGILMMSPFNAHEFRQADNRHSALSAIARFDSTALRVFEKDTKRFDGLSAPFLPVKIMAFLVNNFLPIN